MSPKKGTLPWHERFACEFVLCITSRKTNIGVVEAAVCHLWECWGREEKNGAAVADAERKRKRTTHNKHYNSSLRSDNIRGHILDQHPTQFAQNQGLKKPGTSPTDLSNFFEQSTVDAFFEKLSSVIGRKRVSTINNAIVEMIVQYLMFPAACSDSEEDSAEGPPRGDLGMTVFVPQRVFPDDGAEVV